MLTHIFSSDTDIAWFLQALEPLGNFFSSLHRCYSGFKKCQKIERILKKKDCLQKQGRITTYLTCQQRFSSIQKKKQKQKKNIWIAN